MNTIMMPNFDTTQKSKYCEMLGRTCWSFMSPRNRSVLMTILSYLNKETGFAFPSYSTLEKSTNYCRVTISRAIKELEDLRILEVIREKYADGSNRVNRYRVWLSPAVFEATTKEEFMQQIENCKQAFAEKIKQYSHSSSTCDEQCDEMDGQNWEINNHEECSAVCYGSEQWASLSVDDRLRYAILHTQEYKMTAPSWEAVGKYAKKKGIPLFLAKEFYIDNTFEYKWLWKNKWRTLLENKAKKMRIPSKQPSNINGCFPFTQQTSQTVIDALAEYFRYHGVENGL